MSTIDRDAVIEMMLADADGERVDSVVESGFCTLELGEEGGRLYWAAFNAVLRLINLEPIATTSLEAAALLQDGWSPGDLVERLS